MLFNKKLMLMSVLMAFVSIPLHGYYDAASLVEHCKTLGMDSYAAYDFIHNPDAKKVKDLYKKRAIICHPDAGGTHQAFLVVREAKDVLFDYVGNFKDFTELKSASMPRLAGQTDPSYLKPNIIKMLRPSTIVAGIVASCGLKALYDYYHTPHDRIDKKPLIKELGSVISSKLPIVPQSRYFKASAGLAIAAVAGISGYKMYVHYYDKNGQNSKSIKKSTTVTKK